MTGPDTTDGPERVVEQYDSLVELDATIVVRTWDGWRLVSAGLVRPGRWWAEYERPVERPR